MYICIWVCEWESDEFVSVCVFVCIYEYVCTYTGDELVCVHFHLCILDKFPHFPSGLLQFLDFKTILYNNNINSNAIIKQPLKWK